MPHSASDRTHENFSSRWCGVYRDRRAEHRFTCREIHRRLFAGLGIHQVRTSIDPCEQRSSVWAEIEERTFSSMSTSAARDSRSHLLSGAAPRHQEATFGVKVPRRAGPLPGVSNWCSPVSRSRMCIALGGVVANTLPRGTGRSGQAGCAAGGADREALARRLVERDLPGPSGRPWRRATNAPVGRVDVRTPWRAVADDNWYEPRAAQQSHLRTLPSLRPWVRGASPFVEKAGWPTPPSWPSGILV